MAKRRRDRDSNKKKRSSHRRDEKRKFHKSDEDRPRKKFGDREPSRSEHREARPEHRERHHEPRERHAEHRTRHPEHKPRQHAEHTQHASQDGNAPKTGPQAFLRRVGVSVESLRGEKEPRGGNFERRRNDRRSNDDRRISDSKPRPVRPTNGVQESDSRLKISKSQRVEVFEGEVQKNSRGFAFLLQKPEDIFIPPYFAEKLLTGDVVKAWVDTRNKEVLKVETVKRSIKTFIGTYEARFSQRVVILADKTMREEVLVSEPPGLPGLRSGDKVLVEITTYTPRLEGKILQTYGPKLAPKFDTLAVVVRAQWPQEFSAAVQDEAARLSLEIQKEAEESGYKGRRDMRQKPFVTIDGKDARDFDDAVLVEKTNAGYVLYVAIADVSEFVRPGTSLNDEAYARATSVYFPEWVIPMLPESLSNGACSLRPNEDKLTMMCEMHYDEKGKKKSIKVYESVIRSARRCIYEDVQKEFEAKDPFWTVPYELYSILRSFRNKRGALDLDLPEAKVVLDEHSDTIDIRKVERKDSHRLIEEFMIAANESVTELMEREGWPFVYRVHEPPQATALARFTEFAQALGMKPNLGDGTDPRKFAQFIETLKGNPSAQTLYYLMLRSLKQARYDPINSKHFGLASRAYTHFTSPIRRYPDLIVHRILKDYVRIRKLTDTMANDWEEYLVDACDHCSKRERKAEELDRAVTKVKKARFIEKHTGEILQAKVTNVSDAGVFIELEKWFIDGLVPMDELEGDYFEFVERNMLIKGKRSGRKFKLGDKLEVAVLRCDLDNGYVDFTLAENLKSET